MPNDNPYPQGIRLSPEEEQMIEGMLMHAAQEAQKHGREDIHNQAISLAMRLRQQNHAGEGVPPALHKGFQGKIQRALKAQDSAQIEAIFREYLAALIRLHPDPAREIAQRLVQANTLNQHSMALQQYGPPIIQDVRKKLEILRDRHGAEDWMTIQVDELLDYFDEWLEAGVKAIQKEQPTPWGKDEDLQ